MGHFSLPFYSQRRQVIESLINTTSSYCLPFKICANKIDLKSLKVLILDAFVNPSVISHNFLYNLIIAHVRNYIFNLFWPGPISYHFAGIIVYLNFRNCQKMQRKSTSFMQKILYTILIYVKSNFSV